MSKCQSCSLCLQSRSLASTRSSNKRRASARMIESALRMELMIYWALTKKKPTRTAVVNLIMSLCTRQSRKTSLTQICRLTHLTQFWDNLPNLKWRRPSEVQIIFWMILSKLRVVRSTGLMILMWGSRRVGLSAGCSSSNGSSLSTEEWSKCMTMNTNSSLCAGKLSSSRRASSPSSINSVLHARAS